MNRLIALAFACVVGFTVSAQAANPTLPSYVSTSAPRETLTAHASQTETVSNGVATIVTEVGVSGWAGFTHKAIVSPSGSDANAGALLPDGRRIQNEGITIPWWNVWDGHRHYSPHGFLAATWKGGDGKLVEMLRPSLCESAYAANGNDWAGAEMTLARPVNASQTPRLRVRMQRLAGDPYLYLLLAFDAAGGSVEAIGLTAFPYRYDAPPGVLMRRGMAIGDTVWDLGNEKEKHELAVDAQTPGGVFWFNRGYGEAGGVVTVFVPEEVASLSAGAGWGVGLTLKPRTTTLRLALHIWQDDAGFERGRERFNAELPERLRKLREMSFAWPLREPLSPEVAQASALARDERLPAELRQSVSEARRMLDQAWAAFQSAPAHEIEERVTRERAVLTARERLEKAVQPLRQEWVRRGGL